MPYFTSFALPWKTMKFGAQKKIREDWNLWSPDGFSARQHPIYPLLYIWLVRWCYTKKLNYGGVFSWKHWYPAVTHNIHTATAIFREAKRRGQTNSHADPHSFDWGLNDGILLHKYQGVQEEQCFTEQNPLERSFFAVHILLIFFSTFKYIVIYCLHCRNNIWIQAPLYKLKTDR